MRIPQGTTVDLEYVGEYLYLAVNLLNILWIWYEKDSVFTVFCESISVDCFRFKSYDFLHQILSYTQFESFAFAIFVNYWILLRSVSFIGSYTYDVFQTM